MEEPGEAETLKTPLRDDNEKLQEHLFLYASTTTHVSVRTMEESHTCKFMMCIFYRFIKLLFQFE